MLTTHIMFGFFKKVFGTRSDKKLKELEPLVVQINKECERLKCLSHDALRAETDRLRVLIHDSTKVEEENFKQAKNAFTKNISVEKTIIDNLQLKVSQTEKAWKVKTDEVLSNILPIAFAIVKETARRFSENETITVTTTDFDKSLSEKDFVNVQGEKTIWSTSWDVLDNRKKWDMVHYDEQLLGGIVLHQGKIAEMATGEGKTLVSTLPIFLNALTGKGVHVVTVNDYLARRDCAWNGPLFAFHGLAVDCIDTTPPGSERRRRAYAADITYGTNNEFGFDYLRDNMSSSVEELVQRGHSYSIIDEVDSVLIDDARTPLIISGATDYDDTKEYAVFQPFVKRLYEEQLKIVNGFILSAREHIHAGKKDEESGMELYRAYRGMPKNKDLIKLLSEPGVKLFMEKNEAIYLENNCQRLPEVDKELYFFIDEKYRNVELTDKGFSFISSQVGKEGFFVLPDIGVSFEEVDKDASLALEEKEMKKKALFEDYKIKAKRIHVVQQLLKAYTLFEKNVDYVVLGGRVLIVDEQTGRILDGRRYSEGLHQALEAKEFVKIERPSQTYATITLQNYFRLYDKLAGMTGTAETEAAEFLDIYKLDVVSIPTHKKMIREDKDDIIYKTARVKYEAIIKMVIDLSSAGRPVLVGTTSVETSELLSKMLKIRKIKHQVLNAKYHQQEAEIVANAGVAGTVTIATNMAGRGTDIKLDQEALKAGGLAIIGSERHDSRRVDRQLRGRAGRQGDPGTSQFFVSFEDDLMRKTIGNARAQMFIDSLEDDEIIQSRMVTRSIEYAQKKVEENNFGYRRRLLEYDDVLNMQRERVYKNRNNALRKEITNSDIFNFIFYVVKNYLLPRQEEEADIIDYEQFVQRYHDLTGVEFNKTKNDLLDYLYEDLVHSFYCDLIEIYKTRCRDIYNSVKDILAYQDGVITMTDGKTILDITIPITGIVVDNEQQAGEYIMRVIASEVYIRVVDKYWQRHLRNIDTLKQSVQNAYYEQKDPLLLFKFESFEVFSTMITMINKEIITFILRGQVIKDRDFKDMSVNDISFVLLGGINKVKESKNLKTLTN